MSDLTPTDLAKFIHPVPVGAVIGGGALLVAAALLLFVARRRRNGEEPDRSGVAAAAFSCGAAVLMPSAPCP